MKLTVATCQFPIGRDPRVNAGYVTRQVKAARRRGARVAHFAECALSGYAGIEFPSFMNYEWDALLDATRGVMELAGELKMWVVVGSSHRLAHGRKPHNCVYVINDRGEMVDRYDKRFCTGDRSCKNGDLRHYSPGDHAVTFEVDGLRCGVQICHDFRYQELYRDSLRRGVQLMFHSYHNGHSTKATLAKAHNIWGVMVPATMQTYAANNFMWISANNTTARESSWGSHFVLPDGRIAGKLSRHSPGVLISTVDTGAKMYDASAAWRDRAMRGVFHSGSVASDARSRNRKTL